MQSFHKYIIKKALTFLRYSGLVSCIIILFATTANASILSWFFPNSDNDKETSPVVKHIYKVELKVLDDETLTPIINDYSSLLNTSNKTSDNSLNLILSARSDYKNILAALYDKAYYGGTISIKINGQEASEIDLDTNLPYKNEILITVKANKSFTFSKSEILPAIPYEDTEKAASKDLAYEVGKPAYSTAIIDAGAKALALWKQNGHATAKLSNSNVVAYHPDKLLSSQLVIEPGPIGYYNNIILNKDKEDQSLDTDFILWMINLPKGKKYNPEDLQQAEERLAKLQAIQSIKLTPDTKIGPDGSLDIKVFLQQKSKYNVALGGVYSFVDGANVEASFLNRNLFGRGENLRISANIGRLLSNSITYTLPDKLKNSLNHNFKVNFFRPGTITPDTDFSFNVSKDKSILNNYLQDTFMGKLSLSHKFSKNLSGYLTLLSEKATTYDEFYKERSFVLSGAETSITFDNRDNKTDASKGVYIAGFALPFYNIYNPKLAIKATIDARAYFSLTESKNIILAGRGFVGSIFNAETKFIPPNMVFFAGGGDTIRGYTYRSIGVHTDHGTIGGRSIAFGSAEIRTSFMKNFGAVLFADTGYVGDSALFNNGSKWLMSIGAGARYKTPIGPLRLDVALPLRRNKNDPKIGVYIGIGQAF